MTQVILNNIEWSYNKNDSTITISEKSVPFATQYEVISPKGGKKLFSFSHSTGPEFDKNTKWIYKSNDGIILEVCNDDNMVKFASKNYLKYKLYYA